MPDKLFLERYPLYKKMEIEIPISKATFSDLPKPAINMYCGRCKSSKTYNMKNEYWENESHNTYDGSRLLFWGRTVRALYRCSSCDETVYNFYLYFVNSGSFQKDDRTFYAGYLQKVGQNPPWEIETDQRLSKLLGKHISLYKKGLVNESQSYGIGAYAYYRRIVDDVIDDLLNSILELIKDDLDKEKYESVLQRIKANKVTEEKIELISNILPASLKPNGINPLKTLHSTLSEGLHNKSDEECLNLAETIKEVLIYLVSEVSKKQEDTLRFTESIKRLLNK